MIHRGDAIMIRTVCALAAASMSLAATAQTAPAGGGLLDKAVNQPGTSWTFYGDKYKAKATKAAGIPGDEAVHVTIAAKGANPWDIGATSASVKPVQANDTMLLAVYLRAPDAGEGQTIDLPIGIGEAAAPYGVVAQDVAKVGPGWKLYYASGRAGKAYAPGAIRATVHLAGAKQVVELGPVFLLDMGANQDPAKLPHN